MQGEKNSKQLNETWMQIATTISHLVQERNGSILTARMIVFQTLVLFSILRSFYRGGLVDSWLSDRINAISLLSLNQMQGQLFHQAIAGIIRSSIFILHCSVITLTLINGLLKLDTYYQKSLQNALSKQLKLLLFITIPILFFSTQHVSSFQSYVTVTIDLLNIFFSLTFCCYVQAISGQVEYGSNFSTKVTFGQNSAVLKCIRSLTSCALILIDGKSKNIFMVIMLGTLFVSLYQLSLISKYPKYITIIYQKITEIRVSITISLTTLTFLITATEQSYLCRNAEILFFILSIFLFFTFIEYQKYKRTSMLIEGVEKIKNQTKAISYILQLIKLQQHEELDPESGLIISLILTSHTNQCLDDNCICISVLNPIARKKLLKDVILDHIQIIIKAFPASFALKFISLGYELANSNKIINASLQVQKLLWVAKMKKISFCQYFLLKEMQYIIHRKFVEDGGKSISCQNIFKEDVIKVNVLEDLHQLVDLNLRKYRILALDCTSLNKIQEQAIEINRFILKVQQNWAYIRSIGSFSFQIHQIFIFYFQNIVPSPIQTKQFIKEISTKLEKVRTLRGVCRESINKYLYSKKTCIIESNILESFGTIENITVNCNEVLGFPKDRLLKRSINDIMPQFFASGHQSVITSWLQKGAAPSQVADMVDFGYVDAKLVCFRGYLFLKVHSDGHRLLFYATLIRQNDNDYLLLNSRLEIQGIGKRLIKEGIFVKEHIKQSIIEYTQLSIQRFPLGKTLRTTINLQNLFNNPQLQSAYEQGHNNCNYNPNLLKFQSSIAMTRYKICKDQYFLLKFQNIKKWLSSTRLMNESKPVGLSMKDEQHIPVHTTLSHINQDILLQEEYDSVDPVITNHVKFSHLFKTQVTTKSSIHDQPLNEVTFYSNFTLNVKNCFNKPSKIPMGLYKRTTIFLFTVCAVLIFQFFSLRKVFVVGFQSFNNVMFGDGAVSDNNQILQILYNNILMSKVYCGMQKKGQRCAYLLNSTKQISNILYQMYTNNVQVFLKNRTALTDLKYYASYDIEVPFTVGKTTKNITTLQFMEYYYFAINQHYNFLNNSGNLTQKEAEKAMQILIDNWPQMKYINHNAIYFYLDAGSKQLDLLLKYLLALTAGLNIFLFLLAAGLYYSDSKRASQKYGVFSIYGHMNASLIKDLINHYISIKQSIINEKFRPCEMILNNEAHDSIPKKLRYHRNSCCVLYIVVLWMVLMILGGLEMLQVQLILQPSRNMVYSINDLMDSENYLLEAYFQLKTYYLQYNYNKSVDEISLELSRVLNQTESDFTKTAKKSIDLFSSDSSFIADFNSLLTENVCLLTAQVFPPSAVDYCHNNFTYSMLQFGLVSSMTFYQRNAHEALVELQRRQKEAVNKTEYFTRKVFQDIDDSIFYMFRLYQATQARMYKGLNYSVNKSLLLLDFLNSCAVIIFVSLLGWWLASFRSQRKEMKHLYGAILQFPQVIMKKIVVQDIISRLGMQF